MALFDSRTPTSRIQSRHSGPPFGPKCHIFGEPAVQRRLEVAFLAQRDDERAGLHIVPHVRVATPAAPAQLVPRVEAEPAHPIHGTRGVWDSKNSKPSSVSAYVVGAMTAIAANPDTIALLDAALWG